MFHFDHQPGCFSLTLPIKTVSEANARGKWQQVARKAAQRRMVRAQLAPRRDHLPTPPVLVQLTRIGPKALDVGDNLPSALKAIRDEVAATYGVGDAEGSGLDWDYRQEPGSKEYAVKIRITQGAGYGD